MPNAGMIMGRLVLVLALASLATYPCTSFHRGGFAGSALRRCRPGARSRVPAGHGGARAWRAAPVCSAEPLILTEENVETVLEEARQELGTLFGNSPENKAVGITGQVDFVELEGPCVVVRLSGRFWHQRTTVLDRVASFLQQRIPECVDVAVEDPAQLLEEDAPSGGAGVMY